MTGPGQDRKQQLRDTVMAALHDNRAVHGAQMASDDTGGCFFVPGRIEVLGKHTDYAGGRSLLAAVDRGFVIAAVWRPDDIVRVIDAGTGEIAEFDGLGGEVPATRRGGMHVDTRNPARAPAWSTYPRAVLRRCARNFPAASGGADIAFASDLPQAAGLSSSSALVVAMFLALDAVRGISDTNEYLDAVHSREDLAGYLGAVENGLSFRTLAGGAGVGTMGGSEDHTAILCARPGRLVQYSYAPVRFEAAVPLPPEYTFAIGSSGVRAEKAGAALTHYNRLSSATRELVQLWHDDGAGNEPTLAAIIASDADAPLRLREIARQRAARNVDELVTRLAQFLVESEEIVPAATAALAHGDVHSFAALVQRSQHYAEYGLRNQIPETIHLVESARALGGAAASAFGAGFGGSVWALVREADVTAFLASWKSAYVDRFGMHRAAARFFATGAAAPAVRLDGSGSRTSGTAIS